MSLFFTCKTGTILKSNQSPLGEAHVKHLPSARHTIGAQRPTAIVTQGLEWDPDLPSFTTLRETLAALSDLFAKCVSTTITAMSSSPDPRPHHRLRNRKWGTEPQVVVMVVVVMVMEAVKVEVSVVRVIAPPSSSPRGAQCAAAAAIILSSAASGPAGLPVNPSEPHCPVCAMG